MTPVHPSKKSIVEGLDAYAEAVHPQGAETAYVIDAAFHDVLRVRLYGEFRIWAAVPAFVEGYENPAKSGQRKYRGRPSAEIQGLHPVVYLIAAGTYFLAHPVRKALGFFL